LRDIEIKDRTHQRIRTRGSVMVERSGHLASPGIMCGDLIVSGQISGSVQASGTVIFRTDGKVLGEIHCKRFVVEKRSRLQFLGRIYCTEADVRGTITGDVCCRDQLWLHKGASIVGAVLAGQIKMDVGGQITGPMCVLSRANMASIKANPAFRELAATFSFDDL
jgi:cytoskeletal protein CcmA (bactofilin family)